VILCLARVVTPEELAKLAEILGRGTFIDGKLTAGWHARQVKDNRQLGPGVEAQAAAGILREALLRHEVFRSAVLPLKLGPILFSRTEPGMGYGTHIDDAVMGREQEHRIRSDVSVTVFLSPPEAYEGGELIIEGTGGEAGYKLEAGAAIAYPSTSLHRVSEVTSGRREVAAGWAPSMVRSAERREILFDLDTARRAIFKSGGKTAEFDLVAKSYANLLRQWAEL
jgi:PKHD-type hydroxylase